MKKKKPYEAGPPILDIMIRDRMKSPKAMNPFRFISHHGHLGLQNNSMDNLIDIFTCDLRIV